MSNIESFIKLMDEFLKELTEVFPEITKIKELYKMFKSYVASVLLELSSIYPSCLDVTSYGHQFV